MKGKVLSSKSDILNLTRWLELEKVFRGKEFNYESIVYNKLNKKLKTKDLELKNMVKEIESIET